MCGGGSLSGPATLHQHKHFKKFTGVRGKICNPDLAENRRSEGLARTRLFHPWGREPEGGGGQAPAFRVARCRTRSLVDIRLSPVGSHQGSWGLVGYPYGSVS